jgi:hypothetical protein
MSKVKKIINDIADLVPETLEGLVLASHGRLRQVPGVSALNVIALGTPSHVAPHVSHPLWLSTERNIVLFDHFLPNVERTPPHLHAYIRYDPIDPHDC